MSSPEINTDFSAASALFAIGVNEIETKDQLFVDQMEMSREYSLTQKTKAEKAHDDHLDAAMKRYVADMMNSGAQMAGGATQMFGTFKAKRMDVEKHGSDIAKKRAADLGGKIDDIKAERAQLGNRRVDATRTDNSKMDFSKATDEHLEVWEGKRAGITQRLETDNKLTQPERQELVAERESLDGDIAAFNRSKELDRELVETEQALDKSNAEELNRLSVIENNKFAALAEGVKGSGTGLAASKTFDAAEDDIDGNKNETEADWAESRASALTSLANNAAGGKNDIVQALEEARQKQASIISRVTQQA